MTGQPSLSDSLEAARRGDASAFGVLVAATSAMAYAVAWQVLRHEAEARDALQDAYLTAFRRMGELQSPEAFVGWLRRIVIRTALNRRRRSRRVWVSWEEAEIPPALDCEEERWSTEQWRLLSRALLTLPADERRLCERHYHGGASAERLGREAEKGSWRRCRLHRGR
ncbi:MAG TPA: sigma-70 family RNA polymerase sigma factor [Polyangiaceae bacterium]|nr:sigma-70 family RNA polymerase sigma factor [Polyangiaceae bacterium]